MSFESISSKSSNNGIINEIKKSDIVAAATVSDKKENKESKQEEKSKPKETEVQASMDTYYNSYAASIGSLCLYAPNLEKKDFMNMILELEKTSSKTTQPNMQNTSEFLLNIRNIFWFLGLSVVSLVYNGVFQKNFYLLMEVLLVDFSNKIPIEEFTDYFFFGFVNSMCLSPTFKLQKYEFLKLVMEDIFEKVYTDYQTCDLVKRMFNKSIERNFCQNQHQLSQNSHYCMQLPAKKN